MQKRILAQATKNMDIEKTYHLFCKYCLKDWEVSEVMPIKNINFWWGQVDWSNWQNNIYLCACYECRIKYEKIKKLHKCKKI